MGAEALGHPVGVLVGVYRLAQSLVASIAVSDLGGVGSIALQRTRDQVVLNLEGQQGEKRKYIVCVVLPKSLVVLRD